MAVLASVGAAPALAADNDNKDTVDEAESRRADQLHLTELDGYLQLESQYDWRRVEARRERTSFRQRRDDQTNRYLRLEEMAAVHLAGYYLYRELLAYDVQLGLGLDQIWASERGFLGDERDRDSGWLTEYAVDLALLSRKLINVDVHASRQDERVSRQFLPSLDHEMWRNGVTVRFDSDAFPMELTVEGNRDRYSGRSRFFDDEDEEFDEKLIGYTGTLNVSKHHQLRIDAERRRVEQEYSGSKVRFDTTRSSVNLDERIEFGPKHQHVFETILEYEEDQGDLPRDRIAVGPQVTLNHTDDLSTRYKYQFDRDRFDRARLRSHRADVELTHRLAKVLTTTADLYVGREDSNEGMTSNSYGGLVRWAYNRKNRHGTFSATWGYRYDNTRIGYDDKYATVIDEVVYLRDPLASYLSHANVVPGTIIVTNLERSRVYQPGRDYSVHRRDDGRSALVRTLFGRIPDRASVLVTYRYRVADRAVYRTHQFDVRVQQDFASGWTPYYAVNVRRQDLGSSDPFAYEPSDLNRHRLGLTYRKKRWSAGGEVEFNDESIDPYNALHLTSDWAILDTPVHRLDVRAGVSRFWFRRFERRRATLFDVSLDYRRPMIARMDFTARAAYRFEDDTIQGNTHGIDLATGVEYRIGKLTLSCDVEYDRLEIANVSDDGLSLWLKVRRDFSNLLAR